MKNIIIDVLLTVVTGISGGAAGLYLFWSDKENAEKVSKLRAFSFVGLGVCGAYFIAPLIIDYWLLEGGVASGVSFLSAVFTDAILLTLYKAFKTVKTKIGAIIDKLIQKYL